MNSLWESIEATPDIGCRSKSNGEVIAEIVETTQTTDHSVSVETCRRRGRDMIIAEKTHVSSPSTALVRLNAPLQNI